MKHFVKTSKIPRLGKQIKQLIEKLNETSQEVTKRRSTVSFSPKDVQEVVSLLKLLSKRRSVQLQSC
jgi:hypothetical protein